MHPKIKTLVQTLILILCLIVFLILTNPSEIPLPLILIPYLLFATISYKIASLLLGVLFSGGNISKVKLYSVIIAVVLTNFALLKSIGQLTFQDAAISAAIVMVSAVYINRFSFEN